MSSNKAEKCSLSVTNFSSQGCTVRRVLLPQSEASPLWKGLLTLRAAASGSRAGREQAGIGNPTHPHPPAQAQRAEQLAAGQSRRQQLPHAKPPCGVGHGAARLQAAQPSLQMLPLAAIWGGEHLITEKHS